MAWENFENFASSNIAKLRYDAEQMILEVEFHGGGIYQYYDVPEAIWDGMKAASSQGSYLHSSIKGQFRYSKV